MAHIHPFEILLQCIGMGFMRRCRFIAQNTWSGGVCLGTIFRGKEFCFSGLPPAWLQSCNGRFLSYRFLPCRLRPWGLLSRRLRPRSLLSRRLLTASLLTSRCRAGGLLASRFLAGCFLFARSLIDCWRPMAMGIVFWGFCWSPWAAYGYWSLHWGRGLGFVSGLHCNIQSGMLAGSSTPSCRGHRWEIHLWALLRSRDRCLWRWR